MFRTVRPERHACMGTTKSPIKRCTTRLKKHGCKIANSEYYPSNRQVVDASLWFEDFKLRRADDDAKPDAIRKSFNRARDWLQANDYIREYENKIWFIDDPDGQDK